MGEALRCRRDRSGPEPSGRPEAAPYGTGFVLIHVGRPGAAPYGGRHPSCRPERSRRARIPRPPISNPFSNGYLKIPQFSIFNFQFSIALRRRGRSGPGPGHGEYGSFDSASLRSRRQRGNAASPPGERIPTSLALLGMTDRGLAAQTGPLWPGNWPRGVRVFRLRFDAKLVL